jgi:predicted DNA-binding transcriptional regulator YafY
MIDLVLRYSGTAEQFEEYFSSESRITKEEDGSIIVRTALPENEWIQGWILSFGERIEVLEPEYLRKKIAEIVKKIQKKYQT